MRGNKELASRLLEYSRWHDAPRWSAWVEIWHSSADGTVTTYGTVAAWLPWNRPQKIKR